MIKETLIYAVRPEPFDFTQGRHVEGHPSAIKGLHKASTGSARTVRINPRFLKSATLEGLNLPLDTDHCDPASLLPAR